MKKHLFFLLIVLAAGLGSCSQSTDDSRRGENAEQGLGPDHDSAPEGVGNAAERKQEESNTQLNNSSVSEDGLSEPAETDTTATND